MGTWVSVVPAVLEEWLDLMVSEVFFSPKVSLILSQGTGLSLGTDGAVPAHMNGKPGSGFFTLYSYICLFLYLSISFCPPTSPFFSFTLLLLPAVLLPLSLFSPKIFLSLLFDTHFSFIPFLFASLHISMLLLLSTKTWRWCC